MYIPTTVLTQSEPAMVFIEEEILAIDSASIDFSDITQIYTHLRIEALIRTTQAVVNGSAALRLNADSGSNYDRAQVRTIGTTVTGSVGTGETTAGGVIVPGASADANHFGVVVFEIPFYTLTIFEKQIRARFSGIPNTTTTDFSSGISALHWASTAAVTAVSILPGANNLLAGSRARLYGVN